MKVIDIMKKSVKDSLIKKGTKLLSENPEKNIEKLFDVIRKTVKDKESIEKINVVYNQYKNNTAIGDYIRNLMKTADSNCLQKFFSNFFANAVWYGMPKRAKILQEKGVKLPFVILISPSMRCNLSCTGCYAANYSKEDDICYEEVDRIIGEARELGIYYFIILGGEPFFIDYMLDIYKKYNDCMFTPFTNGTLFDEKLADKIKKLGNVIPMISLEGFEEETDKRRGKGVFKKVMNTMDLFKDRGILFGVSTATSRNNINTVVSDEFIDMLIKKGSKMSWYFIFMPVGNKPDIKLMLTPEQRIYLGKRTRQIRSTKPYFVIDFFNDAPYVGGCIAGKYYCHINSKEDLEPCIFAHFATENIKGKKVIDVFKNEFFRELINRQPYDRNLLRPCMMIDNPNIIREVADKIKIKPTDEGAEKMLHDEDFKKKLDKVASDFKPVADKAWKEDFNEKGNYKMSKG
ncbi:cyclic pyranopterin monophosphate synthase [Clostridium acetireducens DSM 10703]|jgi:MoaA/NifB/PqqE/SkfB family radical SAM enzyme|uniref:Cyclic pyranopterin monophosphate synthase n=1 Tax=Clostridium acetireducens DSM 10703 TaxID=1121290 RepID=A0A1E8EYU0_9CLOT|nr:radical SAM protein [Clostridium acetireducens]OFI06166.1 cyclic pyranopterin monophosphate synthase [Clostridium acetireducens DSM 10703]